MVSFHGSSRKSDNLHFNRLLSSIAYKVSAEKYRRVVFHDTEEWPKLWRKTDFFRRMTCGIWWILAQGVESLNICILMGYFCPKYAIFELKKYRGVGSLKITHGSKNEIRNLVNIHTSSWKSCQINPLYIF